MNALVPATHAVSMDEMSFGLYEHNLQSPGSKGWRRYQIILVNRGDRIAEFRRDLGPAKDFAASPIRIPACVPEPGGRMEPLHTVGELIDIADWHRALLDKPPEIKPADDFHDRYHAHFDQRRREARRLSQFGPTHRVQRSS